MKRITEALLGLFIFCQPAVAQIGGGGGGGSSSGGYSSQAGVYFVDDYGAVGDSTTNDVPAIHAAIAAAVASGHGGIIQFGAKAYGLVSDSLVIEDNNIILRGVGVPLVSGGLGSRGTNLVGSMPAAPVSPPLIKIGHQATLVHGVGFENLGITVTDQRVGNVVWFRTVTDCWMRNCVIEHGGSDAQFNAALRIDNNQNVGSTNNMFSDLRVLASGLPDGVGEGFGILIDCDSTGTSSFNNANQFYNIKLSGADSPGCLLRIQSTTGSKCNSHKFVNLQADFSTDVDSIGVRIDDSHRNMLLGKLDGHSNRTALKITGSCENNVFIGGMDGGVSDDQTDADKKSTIMDFQVGTGGASGTNAHFELPFIQLFEHTGATLNTTNGVLWFGRRTGTNDTLWVYANDALNFVPLSAAP